MLLAWALNVKYQWSNFNASVSSGHVCEVVFKRLFTLNSAISDFANFIAIKFFPLLVIEHFKEFKDVYGIYEVDEGVPHIAPIFEVDGQIKEIVLISTVSVNCLQKHFLSVFVGYVFYHY